MTSSVKSLGCGEVKRTRSRCSIPPQAVAESRAVGVHVLPEKRYLQYPLGGQRPDLGEHIAGPAVLLAAAQARHDAERAGVIAADGDRHPCRVGGRAAGGQHGGEALQRLQDLDLSLLLHARAVQQRGQRADVVGTEYHIHPRRPGRDDGPVLLGEAAADGDLHAGMGVLDREQLAQVAVQPVVGVLADRAGIEDHDVRTGAGLRAPVAGLLKQPGQPL
jgi:hypothetical protein